MNVLDASALLAFLGGEPGADTVETRLEEGGVCGAATWSEVGQKVLAHQRDWNAARLLLGAYGLVIEPVTEEDAEAAASSWRPGSPLSLADRLCLALGRRLGAAVWTADRAWDERSPVHQIR